MTNTEFMYAVVAELWSHGMTSLDSADREMHRAMAEAAREIGVDELARRGVMLYFDPITETVGDVFHTISLLQANKLAKRPNPTFPEASLTLSPASCLELQRGLTREEISLVRRFCEILRNKLQPTVA
jgi:hypothetical protein